MSPEESNAVIGKLTREWAEAKATRSCALEKLNTHWASLRALVEADPIQLAAQNPFQGYFTGTGEAIPYPEGEELNRLITTLKEADSQVEQLRNRLIEAGIPVP